MPDYTIEQIMPARPDQWLWRVNKPSCRDGEGKPMDASLEPITLFTLKRGVDDGTDRWVDPVAESEVCEYTGYEQDGRFDERFVLSGIDRPEQALERVLKFYISDDLVACDECGAKWETEDGDGAQLRWWNWTAKHIAK